MYWEPKEGSESAMVFHNPAVATNGAWRVETDIESEVKSEKGKE